MKTYYFSTRKHAHDIEFYRNRLFNTMKDMENGEIPMDAARYDRISDMYYGALQDLYDAVVFGSYDGVTCRLTGEQLNLANKIVAWAEGTRTATQIQKSFT